MRRSNKKFFIFGFTSMVYKNLIQQLSTKLLHANFNNGILLHGGGWKKMEKLKINNKTFKQKLWNKFKLKNVYNYYGLVKDKTHSKLCCLLPKISFDSLIAENPYKLIFTYGSLPK